MENEPVYRINKMIQTPARLLGFHQLMAF